MTEQFMQILVKEYPDPLFTFIGLFSSSSSQQSQPIGINYSSSYIGAGSVPYTSRSYISSQTPQTVAFSARKTSPLVVSNNRVNRNKKGQIKISISKEDKSTKINRPIAAAGGYRQKGEVSFNLNNDDVPVGSCDENTTALNSQTNIITPQPKSLKQKYSSTRSQTFSKQKLNPKLTTNTFNHKLSKDFSSQNTPSISLYTKMKEQLQKPSFLLEFQSHAKQNNGRNKKHTGSTRFSGSSSPFQTQYGNMTASQTFNQNYHKNQNSNTGGIRSHALSRKGSIQIAQEKLSKLLNDIKSKRIKKKKLDSTSQNLNFNTQTDIPHQNQTTNIVQFSKIAQVSNHHNTSHSSRGKSSAVISRKKQSIQPPQTAQQELRRHINLVYLKGTGYKSKIISGNLISSSNHHIASNSIAENGFSRKKEKSHSPKPLTSRLKTGHMRKSLDKLITSPVVLNRHSNQTNSQLNKTINTIEEKVVAANRSSQDPNKRKKSSQSRQALVAGSNHSVTNASKRQIGTAYTSTSNQKISPRIELVNKYWTNKRELQTNRADKKQLSEAFASNEVNKFKLPKIKRVPFNASARGNGPSNTNNANKPSQNGAIQREASNIKE